MSTELERIAIGLWRKLNPIRRRRERYSLTLAQLSKVSKTAHGTLRDIETGRGGGKRIDIWDKIAKAFNTTPHRLIMEYQRWKEEKPNDENAQEYLDDHT